MKTVSLRQVAARIPRESLSREAHAEATAQGVTLACKRGCSYCCHQTTGAHPIEVLNLAGFLRATLSPKELARLREHLASTAATIRALSSVERGRRRIPCGLLAEDGSCRAYRHRPLRCVAMNSTSATDCVDPMGGHVHVDVPGVRRWLAAIYALNVEVAHGQVGLENIEVELTLALEIALRIPDAEQQWLRGQRIFRSAYTTSLLPVDEWRSAR